MLLGCVGLLTAAIARIPLTLLREGGIVAAFLTTLALVLACVAWDTNAQRRLHPAFAGGAGLIAVSWPLRLALSQAALALALALSMPDQAHHPPQLPGALQRTA